MICLDCIHFKRKPSPSNQSKYYQVNGSNESHEMVCGSCHKNPHLTMPIMHLSSPTEYVDIIPFNVKLKTHFTWHNHECAKWPVMYDARAIETCSGWITDRFTIEE